MPGNDSYTVLLIHSDDSDGDTTFTDSGNGSNCPHAITKNGDVHHETDQQKFGASSIYFDGSDDWLSLPDSNDWDFGTGDFTIDFCLYHFGGTNRDIISQRKDSVDLNNFWYVRLQSDDTIQVVAKVSGADVTVVESSSAVTENTWTHIAIVRYSGSVKIYLGGTEGTSVTTNNFTSWPYTPHKLNIGCEQDNGTNPFSGYLDEIRISKGIARWTSNFTPPAAPYSDDVTLSLSTQSLSLTQHALARVGQWVDTTIPLSTQSLSLIQNALTIKTDCNLALSTQALTLAQYAPTIHADCNLALSLVGTLTLAIQAASTSQVTTAKLGRFNFTGKRASASFTGKRAGASYMGKRARATFYVEEQ